MPKILHVHFKPKNNVGDAAVVLAVRELVGKALGGVRWSSMLMKGLRQAPTPPLLRFINSHDVVIIGGGGFCSKFALPLNDRLVEAIEPPIVLFGVGHNRHFGDPGLDEEQRRSLSRLGQKARLSSVRDRLTRRLLEELGVQAALTGDPAIFLAPVRPWWPPRPRHRRAIGFNVACHGWAGQETSFERVFNLYREVIGGLAADPDADLLYMVHTDREIDAARRLRREFPTLRICRYPAAKLLYVYGQLDLVVSMMLHSAIFAFAAGVPAVSIAYDEKNRAFMDDTGHPERCFDVASASASRILPACHAALGAAPSPADGEIRASYADATDNFAQAIAALCRARGER